MAMGKSALTGLLVGLASGLWMWMEYAVGLHTSHADLGRYTGFISVTFPLLGLYVALRAVRNRSGRLDARTSVRHVATVSASATAAMALLAWGYAAWLNPAWLAISGITSAEFVLQSVLATAIGGLVLGAIVRACMSSTDQRRIVQ
jgi:hypothetical protein